MTGFTPFRGRAWRARVYTLALLPMVAPAAPSAYLLDGFALVAGACTSEPYRAQASTSSQAHVVYEKTPLPPHPAGAAGQRRAHGAPAGSGPNQQYKSQRPLPQGGYGCFRPLVGPAGPGAHGHLHHRLQERGLEVVEPPARGLWAGRAQQRPVQVVQAALLGVREDVVGVGDLLEAQLRRVLRALGRFVGVVYEGLLPPRPLDLPRRGVPGDAQEAVVAPR
eukprot:CAMPEP_0179270792 /NCGR_PEP_ID=MMETSP0797-20121207/31647_1 /TAXON_ID=47934 /ORGANISM="Dinophysis acuminata, Strain DAEP01" /LENGTH=221 /DNA_ID=CAMNT_0020979133 /DNA_START=14 /DNA_END=676 /DNA_ORIENTATION=-